MSLFKLWFYGGFIVENFLYFWAIEVGRRWKFGASLDVARGPTKVGIGVSGILRISVVEGQETIRSLRLKGSGILFILNKEVISVTPFFFRVKFDCWSESHISRLSHLLLNLNYCSLVVFLSGGWGQLLNIAVLLLFSQNRPTPHLIVILSFKVIVNVIFSISESSIKSASILLRKPRAPLDLQRVGLCVAFLL
jgi:hypothetical protein